MSRLSQGVETNVAEDSVRPDLARPCSARLMSARSDERSEEVEATRNGEQYVYAIRSADHQLDQVAALSGQEYVPQGNFSVRS